MGNGASTAFSCGGGGTMSSTDAVAACEADSSCTAVFEYGCNYINNGVDSGYFRTCTGEIPDDIQCTSDSCSSSTVNSGSSCILFPLQPSAAAVVESARTSESNTEDSKSTLSPAEASATTMVIVAVAGVAFFTWRRSSHGALSGDTIVTNNHASAKPLQDSSKRDNATNQQIVETVF